MKTPRFFLACASFLLLSGCDMMGEQYVYTPRSAQEQPATINAIVTVKSAERGMFGTAPKRQIVARIMRINDAYVRAGAQSFTVASEGDQYKISPGRTSVVVTVNIQVLLEAPINPTDVPLTFDVQPGETYRLGASEADNDYGIWIENSQGTRVASAQFGLKRRY